MAQQSLGLKKHSQGLIQLAENLLTISKGDNYTKQQKKLKSQHLKGVRKISDLGPCMPVPICHLLQHLPCGRGGLLKKAMGEGYTAKELQYNWVSRYSALTGKELYFCHKCFILCDMNHEHVFERGQNPTTSGICPSDDRCGSPNEVKPNEIIGVPGHKDILPECESVIQDMEGEGLRPIRGESANRVQKRLCQHDDGCDLEGGGPSVPKRRKVVYSVDVHPESQTPEECTSGCDTSRTDCARPPSDDQRDSCKEIIFRDGEGGGNTGGRKPSSVGGANSSGDIPEGVNRCSSTRGGGGRDDSICERGKLLKASKLVKYIRMKTPVRQPRYLPTVIKYQVPYLPLINHKTTNHTAINKFCIDRYFRFKHRRESDNSQNPSSQSKPKDNNQAQGIERYFSTTPTGYDP